MKKKILFLGVLSAGLTYAQQSGTYKGKVGINTEIPSATLNVKSKTGTTSDTKNFELENANGTKMVTVLDNGKMGVGTETPQATVHIINNDLKKTDPESYTLWVRRDDKTSSTDIIEGENVIRRSYGSEYVGQTVGGVNPGGHTFAVSRVNGNENSGDMAFAVAGNIIFSQYSPYDQGKYTSTKLFISRLSLGYIGMGTSSPANKLHIVSPDANDPLKIEGLKETTDANAKNLVVVDGVVKTMGSSPVKVGHKEGLVCNAENQGMISYKIVQRSGKDQGVFGFCMKKDTEYVWGYMLGGSNIFGTSANGATFGDGL